ncbi:unnamed protein product [Rodentolepis nana]|uniref:Uncharacterized protein n=1 Tax=Rodentolepis nana TaxID=102285 RepID=A0A0R3TIS1_RODNA|nr:unnamed protein product [Rodentolepis nana]
MHHLMLAMVIVKSISLMFHSVSPIRCPLVRTPCGQPL